MFLSHCMHVKRILGSVPQKKNTKIIHSMENAHTLTQQGTPKGTFGDLHT